MYYEAGILSPERRLDYKAGSAGGAEIPRAERREHRGNRALSPMHSALCQKHLTRWRSLKRDKQQHCETSKGSADAAREMPLPLATKSSEGKPAARALDSRRAGPTQIYETLGGRYEAEVGWG